MSVLLRSPGYFREAPATSEKLPPLPPRGYKDPHRGGTYNWVEGGELLRSSGGFSEAQTPSGVAQRIPLKVSYNVLITYKVRRRACFRWRMSQMYLHVPV